MIFFPFHGHISEKIKNRNDLIEPIILNNKWYIKLNTQIFLNKMIGLFFMIISVINKSICRIIKLKLLKIKFREIVVNIDLN